MSNLATITISKHIDREANAVGAGADTIVAVNEFAPDGDAQRTIKLSDFDAPTLEAFFAVMDYITNWFEADDIVVKVGYDDGTKAFDLTASFVRDAESTETPTALATDTPVTVRIEVPGFTANTTVEVTALYGSAFSTEDLSAAAAIGVTLSGTGSNFAITNSVECKVSFAKPVTATEGYVILYPALGTVIPKTEILP